GGAAMGARGRAARPRRQPAPGRGAAAGRRMTDDRCCPDPDGTRAALVGVAHAARALRRAAFSAVLAGRAAPLAELVAAAGASEVDGEGLAARGLVVLDEGRRVVGAAGLSL